MEYVLTAPHTFKSTIKLPSSKSISNRALILKGLSNSTAAIDNLSDCDDTRVMVKAFESDNNVINVGAAGTSMRFLTAYLSRCPGDWTITGTERMKQRPIHLLVDALNSLGAKIEYIEKKGFPPLRIKGQALRGGEIYLAGNISSQFISALLMVAPTMTDGLTIQLQGEVISQPYIRMTLKIMSDFGVKANWDGNTIKIYPELYKGSSFLVESDWSAASYWYEIAALSDTAEIELLGLFQQSAQGDSKVAELFLDLGVSSEFTDKGVILRKTAPRTKKMFHNFVNEPDLAQTFVVTCCMMGIPFLFTGLQSLKIKETDRIEALKAEMRKLGYVVTDRDNSIMEWNGERCVPETDPIIKTYEDHRMAMAFAPAAIRLEKIQIAEPQVVSKSYPNFWKDLSQVGFSAEEIQ
ncbi:MAG: 3-phosphoshikimate 1-carboxyvinyltransferase [Bacteroidetes bacterium]|jgi:3-phosphoshikimate 1-carboxyvinyltransferase|nr:3-phosphoshikimate 1-carboxyvinyltransferase [Bacteroidota bacterium]